MDSPASCPNPPGTVPGAAAWDEEARLAELYAQDILDTPPEPQFDRIMTLAARYFGAPYGSITFIDRERQWFKAAVGFAHTEDPRAESLCALTIQHPGGMVIEDLPLDPRTASLPGVLGGPHARFYAGAPIVTDSGQTVGSICVIDQRPRTFSADDREMLAHFAQLVASELRLRRVTRQLLDQSLTDELSGLPNRRSFLRSLRAAGASPQPLVIGLFDLDGFKRLNDTRGHAAGDEALRRVARQTGTLLAPGEILARYGGDEFTLLLCGPHAPERARQVAATLLEHFPPGGGEVSLSLGLVERRPRPDTAHDSALHNAEALLGAADQAMYTAKKQGGGLHRVTFPAD